MIDIMQPGDRAYGTIEIPRACIIYGRALAMTPRWYRWAARHASWLIPWRIKRQAVLDTWAEDA